ncbi:MAG: hypothetical protein GX649_08025 [Chloroflexi bacterium]|nr:hypothetical protein [Chloroflexota bacterium]
MRPLMACPYCGGSVPHDTTVCPDCHEDLAALVRLTLEHAIWYNEGLAAAQGGDLETARARLLCALERSPRFLPALLLLAKVAAALEDWALARRSAVRALEAAPDDVRVRRAVAAIEAAALQQAPQGGHPARSHPRDAAPGASGTAQGSGRRAGVTTLLGSIFPWLGGDGGR